MTKTAKEIIRHHLKRVYFNGSTDTVARQNGVIPNDTRLGETQIEVELDQAIKEIEAIIMAASPSPRPPVNLTTDPQVAAFRNGYEDAIDYYQDNLKQALYGKEAEL